MMPAHASIIEIGMVDHHEYTTTGPGGSYQVVVGWMAGEGRPRSWRVKLYRIIEINSWWRRLLRRKPRIERRLVRSHKQIRRLVFARGAFHQMKLEADELARGAESAGRPRADEGMAGYGGSERRGERR